MYDQFYADLYGGRQFVAYNKENMDRWLQGLEKQLTKNGFCKKFHSRDGLF